MCAFLSGAVLSISLSSVDETSLSKQSCGKITPKLSCRKASILALLLLNAAAIMLSPVSTHPLLVSHYDYNKDHSMNIKQGNPGTHASLCGLGYPSHTYAPRLCNELDTPTFVVARQPPRMLTSVAGIFVYMQAAVKPYWLEVL